ncbi:hypothetical protein JG687_00007280 [Phytophthora cactorum]|uniref:TOG domain-containing protein n=1 Tax=Phytophthora cactorum TaxID=29920 RepID=A0A8T1UHB4_9STRA|nr:hypothetical protein JG687_00007280 [Phytophthora cactorum]
MPGPALMTPSNIDNNSKTASEDAGAVQTRKVGILGRIKSKLVKNLGLRKQTTVASPTPKDLIKTEPEVPEIVPDQQQIELEQNNEECDDKEGSSPERHESQNDKAEAESLSENHQLNSVLQFDASVTTLETVANELHRDNTISVKESLEEYKQTCIETLEQLGKDDIDEEDQQEDGEMIASYNKKEKASTCTSNPEQAERNPEEPTQETPEEDEDDTPVVFDSVESVLEFVAPSLKIAEEKTRKVALARAGAVKPEMLRVITRRVEELLAKREQQQAAIAAAAVAGSAAINQAEEHVDDEAAFPPAELVDVPQEDAQSSIKLLETSLLNAQNIVGPVCWRKLSSKTWSDRKEALLDVEKAMTEAKSDLRDTRPTFGSSTQSTYVAYSALLHRALGDSIAPVVNTALDTFVTLIKVYGPRIEWRGADVRDVTLLTLLRLLTAMQKPNTRTTRAACRGVLKLARLPNARHPLRYVLSCVFGGEGSSACDPQVQMHLLRLLVPEFGFQADGLGASRVLDVVRKGLTHSSARVRRSAADVALSAQRLLGRDFVLARLQGVKPVTLKELEKSFVDGVGSGGGERPQTVHATAVEASAPGANGGPDLPPVTFGGPGDFSSRRLLHSAPVGIGRLQYTPLNDEVSASQTRASVLSNEEENLMDSILGGDHF